ncbi:hypothetical protein PSTT_16476 [Puccinia striiformis]|uniref:ER-derived vesicles protein ERV14 n=3 Tax=Puccinia striiformis TaxID=27350 RepID=A0A2S4UD41_9BASI|nr:hypothetical protein PSTT_16476 [Puccinia striiformis]
MSLLTIQRIPAQAANTFFGQPLTFQKKGQIHENRKKKKNEKKGFEVPLTTSRGLLIMSAEAWLFLFAVILAAVLLFTAVFYIIMFSDLECDYMNPIDLCNKMNQFVLPEMGAHMFLVLLFVLSFQFVATLINAPLIAWNVNKVMKKTHMYDATEIFRTLAQHKKESFFKLGFYLLSFFYYLFRMIAALVADEV